MISTIILPYKTDLDSLFLIKNTMKQYSSMVRYSFNRFLDGKSQKDIRLYSKSLNNINLLNSWLIQCAIKDAESLFIKQQDLNKTNVKQIKTIFGSKKHFIRRIKGLITNDELKSFRLRNMLIQGESTKMGNRLFKIDLINNQIIFKLSKEQHIKLILPNIRNNYKKQLKQLETINQIKQGQQGLTFSINLNLTNISIIFELPQNILNHKTIDTRYIGIDLNPNEIGLSIVDNYKIIEVRRYIFNIKDNSHDKIKHELLEISKKIEHIFKSYNCKFIFIEDLTIKSKEYHKGKLFNKMINNQWIRNKFISNLGKRIEVIGGKLFEINPIYTSFIGNIKYEYDDSINSSIEIGRRGYDVIIKKNKKFYPELSLTILKDQWKEYFNNGTNTWVDLYKEIKNSKMKYRVSSNKEVFSHISKNSGIDYYFYQL